MPSRGWLPAPFCSYEWSPCCGLDHQTILPITISSTIPNLGIPQSKLLILHDLDGIIPRSIPPPEPVHLKRHGRCARHEGAEEVVKVGTGGRFDDVEKRPMYRSPIFPWKLQGLFVFAKGYFS